MECFDFKKTLSPREIMFEFINLDAIIYCVLEHLLVTYIGDKFKEYSNWAHILSIAVGIAILIPVKNPSRK